MHLSRVQIANFRNFATLDVALDSNVVIVGENRVGKSNFIFALRLVLDPSDQDDSRYVFLSERGAPMGPPGFRRMVARLGVAAKIPFQVHPHMLRHGCGYKLANQGVDTRSLQHYLGHKNIQHTVRYSELSPNRFKDFWRD